MIDGDTDSVVWSKPSTYSEGTGVHHDYSTAPADVPTPSVITYYARRDDSDAAPADKAWYAKLDPGGFIVPHIDQGPWRERWHYPISGQGSVWQDWNDDGTLRHMVSVDGLFSAYRMNHHKPHAVWNPHDEPRIVLIVEYDNPVDQPTTDLIICDMIPEVQTMIDNI